LNVSAVYSVVDRQNWARYRLAFLVIVGVAITGVASAVITRVILGRRRPVLTNAVISIAKVDIVTRARVNFLTHSSSCIRFVTGGANAFNIAVLGGI